MAGGICDVCLGESGGTFVGVAAVPGAPVSIAWCSECLQRDTAPSWVFDHDFIYVAGGDLDNLVEWARQRRTWADGRYMSFEEYVKRWTPELVAQALVDYEAAMRAAPEPTEPTDLTFPEGVTEDRCRVCGKLLGVGLPFLHVGICEECSDRKES